MPLGWEIAIISLWAAVIIMAVIVFGVIRQITPILEKAAAISVRRVVDEGPAVGSRIPHFEALGDPSSPFTEADLRLPGVLLFTRSECAPCEDLLADMKSENLGMVSDYLTVVTDQKGERGLDFLPGNRRVAIQAENEVQGALKVRGVPYAIALDENGIVKGKQTVNRVAGLTNLAAVATSAPSLGILPT